MEKFDLQKSCNRSGYCTPSFFNIPQQSFAQSATGCFVASMHYGFSDFMARPVDCSLSSYTALYCQGKGKRTKQFQNELSDIKVVAAPKADFSILSLSRGCNATWFKIDQVCIKVLLDTEYPFNDKGQQFCQQYDSKLAQEVLRNISLAKISQNYTVEPETSQLMKPAGIYSLDPNSTFIKFWTAFYQKQSRSLEMRKKRNQFYININSSGFPLEDMVLKLGASLSHDRFGYGSLSAWMWSLLRPPALAMDKMNERRYRFVMCEKAAMPDQKLHPEISVSCSDSYRVCADSTCIHDALWCDGVEHCSKGEDEQQCQHVCSQQNINCITECHIQHHCKCISDYFQCLSGGCIPLQKICDQTIHCSDASDEPLTCTYSIPRTNTYTLPSIQHANSLILKQKEIPQKCVDEISDEYYNLIDNTFEGKTKDNCSVSALPTSEHDLLGLCVDWTHRPKLSTPTFPIHQLCIHRDRDDCQNTCSNGFHLLNCQHMFCVGRFKCVASYCVSLNQVCDGVCDCPGCEEEGFCSQLLCPGLLLSERLGSKLYCTTHFLASKLLLNRRQLISTNDSDITDEFPIYIRLQKQQDLYDIPFPELITYFSFTQSKFTGLTVNIFQRMFSIIVLDIAENRIKILPPDFFLSMSILRVLNISSNNLKALSNSLLCPLVNLKYLFIEKNDIAVVDPDAFLSTQMLRMISIHSNKLHSARTQFTISEALLDSLQYLSSDLPRLCCVFFKTNSCSPALPLFMSCSNMITSKSQVAISWIISIATVLLNFVCVISLITVLFIKANIHTGKGVALFISLNLSLAEMITSICLLSYPSFNVYFDGVFGIMADQWRYSWQCLGLETLFFISSQASLATSVIMSVHFAIIIPSVVPQTIETRRTVWFLAVIWLAITALSLVITFTQISTSHSPFNYFCLPFITYKPTSVAAKTFYILLLVTDFGLICTCLSCYIFLFVYIRKQIGKKSLKAVQKRTEALQKFAYRMAIVIFSNSLTWTPILLLQLLVLVGMEIQQQIILWVLLSCLPVNLLIDPVLVIRNTFK